MTNDQRLFCTVNAARRRRFIFHLSAFILFIILLACSPLPVLVPTPTAVPPVVLATATATLPASTPLPSVVAPITPTTTAIAGPRPPISNLQSPITNAIPAIVAEVDLGVRFEQSLQRAVALDIEGGHVFVDVPGVQTLVLSAQDLKLVDRLPVGGDLAVDHGRGRLYVGAPSGVTAFDLDTLQPMGKIFITAGPYGSTPVVDESIGTVFVVHDGVYVVDPMTLDVTGRISGTFPITAGVVPNPRAVDAAFDAERRLLYVSLNNGIPGSNNGNTLMVYDLRMNETVYRDDERSIVSLVADEKTGHAFIARSRFNTHSLTAFALERNQAKPAWRINGIVGSIKVDAQRGRVYLADSWGPSPRLLALDAATGALITEVSLPRTYTLAAFDAEADQLYLISSDGHLMVMQGHGAPVPATETLQPEAAITGTVAWIAPSPNYVEDKTFFAAWTPMRYASGPLGAPAGPLMSSASGEGPLGRIGGGLPPHLFVNALAFSPDYARDRTLFAALLTPDGRGGGLYVSNDAGRSWRPTTNGLGDWIIAEIVVAPGFPLNRTVFALTWTSGLYRSTDGGATWQRTNYRAGPPVAMNARTLAISPDFVNDQTLIVSTGEGAFISRDGGENWWPMVENRASSLVFANDRVLMGSFTDAGVMRSNDGGATWQAASRGLHFELTSRVSLVLSPDFSRDQTSLALIRSADQSAVYRTTDGGATWQIETLGWAGKAQVTAIAFAPDGTLFFGLSNSEVRIVKPADLKWSNASVALDKLSVEAIALSPDFAAGPPRGALFIGNARAGVFLSTDSAKTWVETNMPARDSGNSRLLLALSPDYANDKTLFASAAGQVFRSEDGGANWQALTSGLGNFFPSLTLAISPQFANDRTVLVGGSFRAPRVMRSTDGGETWIESKGLPVSGNTGLMAIAFVPGNSHVVYAWVDQAGLYRSGDNGAAWTRVYSPTASTGFSLKSLGISPDFARDRFMFAGALGPQGFRRSADGGASWHPSDAARGLPPNLIGGNALAVSPDFPRERLIWLGTDKGVFRSEDGGATWKPSSVGLPTAGANVLALAISPRFTSDRTLFAGLADRGLYISTDAGATWKPAR